MEPQSAKSCLTGCSGGAGGLGGEGRGDVSDGWAVKSNGCAVRLICSTHTNSQASVFRETPRRSWDCFFFFFFFFLLTQFATGGRGVWGGNSMSHHVTLPHNRNICVSVCVFCLVYRLPGAPFPSGVLMNDCAILMAQSWRLYGRTSWGREGGGGLKTHSGGETEQLKGLKSLCAVRVLRSRAAKKGSEG